MAGCLILLLLGLAALVQVPALGLWRAGSPGPGLVPAASALALVLLCGAGLWQEWSASGRTTTPPAPDRMVDSRRLGLYLVALVAYTVALEPLGYLLSTALVFLCLLRWAELQPWRQAAALTTAAVLACELVFVRLLGVDLPPGRLF